MLITVHVHPRASRSRVEWKGDVLEVWVNAPPVKGAANQAVLEAVAKKTGVRPSAVTLRSGARSRTKIFEVMQDGGR